MLISFHKFYESELMSHWNFEVQLLYLKKNKKKTNNRNSRLATAYKFKIKHNATKYSKRSICIRRLKIRGNEFQIKIGL